MNTFTPEKFKIKYETAIEDDGSGKQFVENIWKILEYGT